MSRPEIVWESTWKYMTDDFIYKYSKLHRVQDDELKNYALLEIEKFLGMNSSSLRNFSTMPFPDSSSLSDLDNRLINEEHTYDVLSLAEEYVNLFNMLTEEQRSVFEEIMKSVDGNTGGMFFVYGDGGTGKTFLWKTLSAAHRSKREIVLNVASSGIASLLLTGGRTAHSRFRIPLNLNEDSVCHIKADSDVAKLLHQTKLIIWDEAPMVYKHAFEALDRTMNDIFNFDTSRNSEISFGGKAIVFGGDFRQVLPVVRNGGRQETVNASLSSSYLWSKCKVLTLSRNMRLTVGRSPSKIEEINSFAKWLLDIGEGNVGGPNDGEATIEVPSNLIINDTSDPISSLIEFVYLSILENFRSPNYFSDRAILALKNEVVNEINDRLLALFPGEEREYLSSDHLCATENVSSIQERLYTPDVLNGLKVSGLPNHRLVLKVGVPVMLCNIDQKNGLCNGTRLKVTKLYNRVIEAKIISGANIGTRTYIPRISLVPSDKKIPFSFQRRQFPVVVCFAMTINKSQGQSLSRVGLYLRQPVFTHDMDRGFFVYIEDRKLEEQPLPAWYNKLNELDGYPVGNVFLITDDKAIFDVKIKESTDGYCVSNGWSTLINVLEVDNGDYVVFELMDAMTFRITHFKSYPHPDQGSKFHVVMSNPENQNLWLPRDFMQEHFNGDNLFDNFVIVFDKTTRGPLV
ncbi:uncharacterized protein LOC110924512 [Helianthus annuus]|uniref:uncharacterized protein LOC110924512 n=1 Tax=Helianthus annuus TaxID=4232 RepID=UPI000B90435E|nr:uncharacterized protein LOC110924512 [Helianthus annuus]